ncbi:SapC family protein [Thiosulfativibrio zosterae]|uniref:SapC family protein n=1 Tax=Thiosulfativibrio zosterae TaxID=2675053 RepID=A0A6F8PQI3_9GAMM|nr:SapC family protein [Thiosulfativibrio zosterae]BBP44288.1 hypothetical protein THMIRHAT_20340 [Thiosulfativibrio zosterae]
MATWVAVSKEKHKNAGWKKFSNYSFAQVDAVTPVLLAELMHLLPYYPLAFTQNADGQYQLVVVQSLQAGVNLFVNKAGQWMAPYVPSSYRGYPFLLIPQGDQLILCVDESSENFHAELLPGDTPFMQADELSDELQSILNFHNSRSQNQKITQELVNKLSDSQVIVPWDIQLKPSNESDKAQSVNGLFKIDELKLRELDAQVLVDLNTSGALSLAYAQLFSQIRLKDFSQRYEYFNKMHQKPMDIDLDKLFGEDDDGLKF